MTKPCLHCAIAQTISDHAEEHCSGVGDTRRILAALIEVIADVMITAPDPDLLNEITKELNGKLPQMIAQKATMHRMGTTKGSA